MRQHHKEGIKSHCYKLAPHLIDLITVHICNNQVKNMAVYGAIFIFVLLFFFFLSILNPHDVWYHKKVSII